MAVSAGEILARMVRIASVTGAEAELAAAVASWCREAGLEVAMPEVERGRSNVVARWPVGRGPRTLLTGHLDTVPVGEGWTRDPYGAEVADGRLYGRGACDMKGGLAAALAAALALKERGQEPAGDLILAFVVGEEEDSAGTRALVGDGIEAERAVLAEPTGLELVIANRGLLNYRVEVRGASAHASAPELGRNAVVAAARIALELDAAGQDLQSRRHPGFGSPSLTVGTIQGGTRPYVVPDRCRLEIDRRLNPGETREQVEAEIQAALARARSHVPWLDAEVIAGPDYPPFELPAGHPLVEAMRAAIGNAGLTVRTGAWRAASDAGFLVHRGGIPCVLFGPGNVEEAAHRPDESIELQQVEAAQRVFENILLAGEGRL